MSSFVHVDSELPAEEHGLGYEDYPKEESESLRDLL